MYNQILTSTYDISLMIEKQNDSLHNVFNDGCLSYFVSRLSVCLSTTNIKYPQKHRVCKNIWKVISKLR